jgi:hypothetical protein
VAVKKDMGEREYSNLYALLLKLSLKTRGFMSATLGCTWIRAISRCEAQCGLQDAGRVAGRRMHGAMLIAGCGGGARRRARRRSRDARRGVERKRGAERRGAGRSRFPRRKDRLPGCDAGRGTQNAARGRVGSPSEGLPSGGLNMKGRRERGM